MSMPKINDGSTQTKLRPLRKESEEHTDDGAADGQNVAFAIYFNHFIQCKAHGQPSSNQHGLIKMLSTSCQFELTCVNGPTNFAGRVYVGAPIDLRKR